MYCNLPQKVGPNRSEFCFKLMRNLLAFTFSRCQCILNETVTFRKFPQCQSFPWEVSIWGGWDVWWAFGGKLGIFDHTPPQSVLCITDRLLCGDLSDYNLVILTEFNGELVIHVLDRCRYTCETFPKEVLAFRAAYHRTICYSSLQTK